MRDSKEKPPKTVPNRKRFSKKGVPLSADRATNHLLPEDLTLESFFSKNSFLDPGGLPESCDKEPKQSTALLPRQGRNPGVLQQDRASPAPMRKLLKTRQLVNLEPFRLGHSFTLDHVHAGWEG